MHWHHRLDPCPLTATPGDVFAALRHTSPWLVMLHSAQAPTAVGRFSILLPAPRAVLECRLAPDPCPGSAMPWRLALIEPHEPSLPGSSAHLRPQSGMTTDPWAWLREQVSAHAPPAGTLRPARLPFLHGGAGWIAYDMLHTLESVPPPREPLPCPAVGWVLSDVALIYDHHAGRWWLSVLGRGRSDAEARGAAERTTIAWHDHLLRATARHVPPAAPPQSDTRAKALAPAAGPAILHLTDRAAYAAAIEHIRGRIAAGDVYEVNLSHTIVARTPDHPDTIYRRLCALSPAPFAARIAWPGLDVLCASPERFLRVTPDGWVRTCPIKGTRPRGGSPREDRHLRRDLARSEKDRAEHVMIVDLLRNDLGRVCRPGTVRVADLMRIETYAQVFQMVSTIAGRLRPDCHVFDLLRACFPGGSMTGAPKIMAMRIIRDLESGPRGLYAGTIGYIDSRGHADFNIVIRTAVVTGDLARMSVGGAIVADSDAHAEYDETLDKAAGLLAAFGLPDPRREPAPARSPVALTP